MTNAAYLVAVSTKHECFSRPLPSVVVSTERNTLTPQNCSDCTVPNLNSSSCCQSQFVWINSCHCSNIPCNSSEMVCLLLMFMIYLRTTLHAGIALPATVTPLDFPANDFSLFQSIFMSAEGNKHISNSRKTLINSSKADTRQQWSVSSIKRVTRSTWIELGISHDSLEKYSKAANLLSFCVDDISWDNWLFCSLALMFTWGKETSY